jgi:hypothetical protein
MLANASGTQAVSYLGGIDAGSFWICGENDPAASIIQVATAPSLTLHDGADDFFGVSWQSSPTDFCLQVHRHADPSKASCQLRVSVPENLATSRDDRDNSKPEIQGDPVGLKFLPRAFVLWGGGLPRLLIVDQDLEYVQVMPLNWFETQYDKQFQSIQSVIEISGSRELVISVQRSSRLIVFDPVTNSIARKVELADRHGNPRLLYRRKFQQIWASDYDTLVCLDVHAWTTVGTLCLQENSPEGARQFIGMHSFTNNEERCIVARPYSSDVVIINPDNFSLEKRVFTGKQPFDATVLAHHVVARDWKTGSLLKAAL